MTQPAAILAQWLDEAVQIAADAGRRILEVYDGDFDAMRKRDGSPLTEADRASHQLIVARLGELTPHLPVLSEESAAADYAERATWERFWLVDPLDGTREFVKRNGEFTVNIALVEGERPVLGVVHVPVSGVTYTGCAGGGAWKAEGDAPARPIHAGSYDGGSARVVASRSHAGEYLAEFLRRLEAREGPYQTVSMGSSLKICLVAEGRADVYPRLGPTSEWDTAAAQCVVEAAGGRLVDVAGRPLVYNKTSLLNPWFLVCDAGDFDWGALVPAVAADRA